MSELNISQQGQVGVIELNIPKKLNSLTLGMVKEGHETLKDWESNSSLEVGILRGAGPKAFCAGGDVVGVINQIKSANSLDEGTAFFQHEYRFDEDVHKFTKPLLTLTHGVTMGGGLGLINGASHRIVSENSVLAMPEITIGFFPDVGAGRFLKTAPEGVGLFLGLTGAKLSAEDAIYLGLADDIVYEKDFSAIQSDLTKKIDVDDAVLKYRQIPGTSQVERSLDELKPFLECQTIQEFDELAKNYCGDNQWISNSLKTYLKGSPLSAAVIFRYLKSEPLLNWKDTFSREFLMAKEFSKKSDFAEGVRALLIDKDKSPQWIYSDVNQVPEDEIHRFFNS